MHPGTTLSRLRACPRGLTSTALLRSAEGRCLASQATPPEHEGIAQTPPRQECHPVLPHPLAWAEARRVFVGQTQAEEEPPGAFATVGLMAFGGEGRVLVA